MFGKGCIMNHQGRKFSGAFIERTYRRFFKILHFKVLTPPDLEWACPYCRLVFLKSEKEIKKWLTQKPKSPDFTSML